ncbi:MAG: TraX family protein [Candidatus Electrothrix aestuarii]|uniref:TraX family protein n=1 Tax=Candidatus Electrothrix aestuarii TaxID=3062594 RepID=A0AAU8LRF6_9BACT|nr:TraX family protein [Candidatus Electrothrix aestuarii]
MTRKDLACLFMLIDHIGAVFFPDVVLLRIVGRLALPVFAYQVALGIRHTSDTGRYFLRLFGFALLSQPFSMLLFHTTQLNILFSFALFVLLVHLVRRERWLLFVLIFFSFPLLEKAYGLEYGLYAASLVLVFSVSLEGPDPSLGIFLFALLNLIFVFGGFLPPLQIFSLASLPLIYIDVKHVDFKLGKYFYYLFYPVHLAVLLGWCYVFAI